MKILGVKKLFVKKITVREHSFTKPLYYSRNTFGIKNDNRDELVSSFCLDISATQMKTNFKIFEDMPNVHEWPISKLIQRELDKQRALMISRDYLLSDGYLKYFPPIIAVLIPTNLENLPSDTYSESTDEEIDELKKHIFQFVNEESAACVNKASALARGIYDINDGGDSGYLVWDENVVSAVIIDGQHRYKALLEAMSSNKEFQECHVTVNLIDLVPVCKRQGSGPTAVARDLFVSINNTPVEVDEARLILMDDRDGLATFTQVLVDDSETEFPPAIRPELIDWRCDQGKHDNSLALTGVLTLRGVIGASMFENRSIASVDDRVNRKHVQKWLSSLFQWVGPDNEIAEKLGKSECLQHRFEIACAAIPNDDDEDDQPFLFSYSAAAAGVIKTKFRDLYLAVFREVYSNLTPFTIVSTIATDNGAFEKTSDLHHYLRAFSGRRKELEKESQETKQKVVIYKTHLKDYCDNHILLTVMGQKALFKALFEAYLSDVDIKANELLTKSKEFVESFNEIYDALHLSNNFDECFFSTKLTLQRGIQTKQAGDLGRAFWRGVILGHNGEIDYGPTAVELLKNVLIDVLTYESGNEFEFKDRNKIINRHVALLRRIDSDIEDSKAKNVAEQIVKGKEAMVQNLLS